MTSGEKIKKARKRIGITQLKLNELTDIPLSSIKQYETGVRKPKIEVLIKIAAALGCSPMELLDDNASITDKWDIEYNSPQLSKDIKTLELVQKYESLNEKGKEKVQSYIDDLHDNPKYIKEGE